MRSSAIANALTAAILLPVTLLFAADVDANFHHAPASAQALKNPLEGQSAAADAGRQLYASDCASCHGQTGKGTGNIPSLVDGRLNSVKPGEIFWFITRGNMPGGMPSWASLPETQRWQIVTYIESIQNSQGQQQAEAAPAPPADTSTSKLDAPPPTPPFTDFRSEKPGTSRKITVNDLPQPYSTKSAENGPKLVARPENVWPIAPAGFKVELYASGLDNPRTLRTAPNGDIFLAESDPGKILIYRGIGSDGKPEQSATFATGLKRPYGLAFYPPGADPQYLYVGSERELVRFPYHNGDLKASGAPEHIADLPGPGGHWTRSVVFSQDGKKMFVAVGSGSNIDDPDTSPREKNRADILWCDPTNCKLQVYAYGIRNAGGGLAIDPQTGELWCSVNERDGLGDNLVPDYITHVQEGGFYGWPWWYMGGHQDPRHQGKHPELKDKVIVPDVLLQPHNASLGFAFYEGIQFPAEYRGDIFASEHGSWNKSVRVGYEVIRVPLHQTGDASGDYEDFLTGFVLPDGNVWGRPVGVTVALDGSLLVSDDGSNSVWRVSYSGK
ncbi:MAG: c-type cytochrome [Candidatus Sulfotelmatobacter sp.]|jgi:glucose/arabinose dehydrogenase